MDYQKAKEFVLPKLEKELKPSLYYHNYQHTLDVCKSIEALAEMESINGEDLTILRTAAAYHDTGFIWQYDNNEPLACDFAKETLPSFGYNDEQIEKVCDLILATQIPQNPKSKMSEILCDADLDYIGRDDFFITALRLHREWSENSTSKITFKDWYLKQLQFVQKHEYWTEAARKLRGDKKTHNLSQIKELLNLLEATVGQKK
jgi:uncharacterized protein